MCVFEEARKKSVTNIGYYLAKDYYKQSKRGKDTQEPNVIRSKAKKSERVNHRQN